MEARKLPADHYALMSAPGCDEAAREELYVAVATLPRPSNDPTLGTLLAPLRHPPIVHCKYEFPMGAEMRVAGIGVSGGIYLARRLFAGPLAVAEALTLAERLALALALAHAHEVVHGDLTPRTVFLPGAVLVQAKLLDFDFGPWRVATSEESVVSAGDRSGSGSGSGPGPGSVVGSPDDDPRADIFSLGCLLYQCLTGEPPFVGKSAVETMYLIATAERPHLGDKMVVVPPGLEELVGQMLAPDARDRPGDAAQVAADLGRLLATL